MGGSVSKSETSLQDVLTPGQLQLLQQLTQTIGRSMQDQPDVYGGQIAPDASQIQQQVFEGLGGIQQQERDDAIRNLMTTGGVDPETRKNVYDAQRGVAQNEFDDFSRQIMEKYNAQGAGRSGGLRRSLARGAERFSTNLASINAGLEQQDEIRRVQGIQQGLGALGGARQQDLAAGGLQRQITGQQSAEDYAKWQANQPYGNPWLQFLPQVFGTQAQVPVTTTSRQGGGLFTGG